MRRRYLCLLALALFALPGAARAQLGGCSVVIPTNSACPFNSHCLIRTQGLVNASNGLCGANIGATLPCSEACGGGSVFTATVIGVCMGEDGCENGDVAAARALLRDGHVGRVMALDCHGAVRIVLASNRQPAKPASESPKPASTLLGRKSS